MDGDVAVPAGTQGVGDAVGGTHGRTGLSAGSPQPNIGRTRFPAPESGFAKLANARLGVRLVPEVASSARR